MVGDSYRLHPCPRTHQAGLLSICLLRQHRREDLPMMRAEEIILCQSNRQRLR
jgi:hypothetical protein